MKLLSIFRTDEGVIVERKNEFGTRFKSVFETPEAMLEYLDGYKRTGEIAEYELNVSNEFWGVVILHLSSYE